MLKKQKESVDFAGFPDTTQLLDGRLGNRNREATRIENVSAVWVSPSEQVKWVEKW